MAAALSCGAALAQGAPDPEKLAIAARILEASQGLQSATEIVDATVPQIVEGIKRRSPNLSNEVAAQIGSELAQEMKAGLPMLAEASARAYASHFTLQELKDIDAFYHTPAGRKFASESPKMRQEITPLAMEWGKRAAAEALQKVIAKLRAQGVKI
jgi:hypothetical protein